MSKKIRDQINNFGQFLNEGLLPAINKVKKNIIDDSIPITNNFNILEWLVDCQQNSYINNQKNLSQNLLKELEEIFGSSNKSLRLEFMTKVWILEYNGLTFNVFTAKGKGTSIEICGYDYKDIAGRSETLLQGVRVTRPLKVTIEREIIKFLEELHRLINMGV